MSEKTETLEVSLQKDPAYFNRYSNSFVVTGTSDGNLQLDICDDFADFRTMKVVGTLIPGSDPPTYSGTGFDLTSVPTRVLFGRVKMTVAAAEALVVLLQGQIALTKKATEST